MKVSGEVLREIKRERERTMIKCKWANNKQRLFILTFSVSFIFAWNEWENKK